MSEEQPVSGLVHNSRRESCTDISIIVSFEPVICRITKVVLFTVWSPNSTLIDRKLKMTPTSHLVFLQSIKLDVQSLKSLWRLGDVKLHQTTLLVSMIKPSKGEIDKVRRASPLVGKVLCDILGKRQNFCEKQEANDEKKANYE